MLRRGGGASFSWNSKITFQCKPCVEGKRAKRTKPEPWLIFTKCSGTVSGKKCDGSGLWEALVSKGLRFGIFREGGFGNACLADGGWDC